MSLLNPHGIYNVEGTTDPEPLVQNNCEAIVKYLFKRSPSLDTASSGPPTTGTWELNALYWDVDGILWQCTVAGTPGTWIAIGPTRDNVSVPLPGLLSDDQVAGLHQRSYARMIHAVDLTIDGVAPVGASFVIQILVGGVLKSQQYTVAAGQPHNYVAVTGDGNGGAGNGLRVAAATTLQVKVITPSGVVDATVAILGTAA